MKEKILSISNAPLYKTSRNFSILGPRGTTGFRISLMVAKILESGILTFINILVKLCIYPYIVNLFGIQESLESSQESWNQARNLGILPRFQKIPNHVEENS